MTDVKEVAEAIQQAKRDLGGVSNLLAHRKSTETDDLVRANTDQAITAILVAQRRFEEAADLLLSLEGELAEAKAQVRVAYGFDRDAVFANIDRLTAQIKAKDEALGCISRMHIIPDAGTNLTTLSAAIRIARSAYEGLDRLPESPSGDAFRAAGEGAS